MGGNIEHVKKRHESYKLNIKGTSRDENYKVYHEKYSEWYQWQTQYHRRKWFKVIAIETSKWNNERRKETEWEPWENVGSGNNWTIFIIPEGVRK